MCWREVSSFLLVVATLSLFGGADAWIPSSCSRLSNKAIPSGSLYALYSASTDANADSTTAKIDASSLRVPVSLDEMTRQVARAMQQASTTRNQKRQIARILLPRDATADDFGTYYETETVESSNTVLVPPDESWQGGILQLYRAAAPTCETILRQYANVNTNNNGLPPRITEDRTIDESGVDGVGRFTTEDSSVTVYLQPTQEVANDMVELLERSSSTSTDKDGITLLLNPQWRQVDDALDSASKGTGFLSGLANFLGGKGGTLQRLAVANFVPVYNLEGYVCRGSNIRLLQVLDSDWAVFCQRDDNAEAFIAVGTHPTRPTYQLVESMLNQAGISYKYSRDMGWEPKL